MNRRTVVMSGVALVLAGRAGSPLAAQEATPDDPAAADGGWSFTDDRGRQVHLPAMPQRVVADLAAGVALWELGITPVGLFGYPGLFDVPDELGDIPFLDVTSGTLDVEELIVLDPDLIVGQTWDAANPDMLAQMNETEIPGLSRVAPTIGILAVETPLDQSLARFEDLAAALGADLATPAIVANHEAFDVAAERVRKAAAANPDLKVMAFSPYADGLWVGNPGPTSDLGFFAGLGVHIYAPDATGADAANVFQPLSWELLGTIPIDLYLRDDRSDTLTSEQLLAHPVFSQLPAAQDEQIGTWTVQYFPTFTAVTRILDTLATSLETSVVVAG